jgi:hypothetical protein
MNARRGVTTAGLISLVCLLAAVTLSCNIAAVPGRFTYIVKYEVTTDAAVSVSIDYIDELGATPNAVPAPFDAANPWSYEFPAAFHYDDPVFYPTLDLTATGGLDPGETVTAKIIWKDYRKDFQEQVLVLDTVYNDGTTVVATTTLTGPELPRP